LNRQQPRWSTQLEQTAATLVSRLEQTAATRLEETAATLVSRLEETAATLVSRLEQMCSCVVGGGSPRKLHQVPLSVALWSLS